MKTLIKNYVFTPASKQITLTGLSGLKLEQFLLITNVTSNTIIYNFADPLLGGSLSTNVLTLDYNTVTMNDTDSLQIFLDTDQAYDPVDDMLKVKTVGAATEATLLDIRTSVQILDNVVSGNEVQVDVLTLPAITGTVTANLGTLNGAATAANQTTIISHIDTLEASNSAIQTAVQILDDAVATDGAAALTKAYQIAGTDGTNAQILSTNTSGHVNIADGGNSITVDGTVAVSGSVAVTGPLTDTQLRATPVPISVSTIPSHPVTNAGTFATQVTSIAAGDNNIGNVDIITMPAITGTVELGATSLAALETTNAVQSGTWNINNVSGTVSLPTGAATAARQDTMITSLSLLDDVIATDGSAALTKLYQVGGTDGTNTQTLSVTALGHLNIADGGNSITVDGPLTDVQLRATSVPIIGTVELGATSLAALENITVTVPGTIDLGTISLEALETITVEQSNAALLKVTAVPSLGSHATRGYAQISDGTTSPAIKAASTAAVAADPALVVAISPNNTIPVALSSVPSHPVTNAGTFATQVTSIAAGDNNIGNVDIVTMPAVALDAATLAALETTSVLQSGTWNITNISGTVSLPSGASTAANQATEITSLQLLDDVVATDGAAALTKLYQVGGTDGTNAQILSTNASGHLNIADGGNSITIDGNVGILGTVPVSGTFWQATQPVSLASQPLPTGAATETTLAAVKTAVELIDNTVSGNFLQTKLSPDATATYAPSNATTTAYAASLVVKAGAGVLYNITGYNAKATTQFIQIHNTASLPADAAVPQVIFAVPPTSNFSFDLTPYGRYFSTGIVLCNSSTGPTKTIGAADCWFDAQYK